MGRGGGEKGRGTTGEVRGGDEWERGNERGRGVTMEGG